MSPWIIGAIVGAIIGAVIGWLIAAIRSRATHLGGGWFRFEGMGCLQQIRLQAILAVVGAVVGAVLGAILG